MSLSTYNVLLAPHVSEKSSLIADKFRQFAFRVMVDANKFQIKDAIEKSFDVKVKCITVARYKGKKRNFAQRPGQRKAWKKAYVTLEEGHDIQFTGKA